MTKLATQLAELHRPIDKTLFRVLSFSLAIGHAALIMWEATLYGSAIGGFNAVVTPLLIWAICSGVIFGIGFTPIMVVWRVLFSPYLSIPILVYFTILYLFV